MEGGGMEGARRGGCRRTGLSGYRAQILYSISKQQQGQGEVGVGADGRGGYLEGYSEALETRPLTLKRDNLSLSGSTRGTSPFRHYFGRFDSSSKH